MKQKLLNALEEEDGVEQAGLNKIASRKINISHRSNKYNNKTILRNNKAQQ